MKMKTLLLGTIAYLLVTFPLAFVWHLVAFKRIYDELGIFNRQEPIVALGFLVIVIQGLLLSYVYPIFRRSADWTKDGLKFGLIMGLFLWSSQVVAAAAKHEVTSLTAWLGIETIYFALQFTLVGLALGWVYGHKRSFELGES
ncbi:MAG TPA: DUF1761 domain-containing protein [Vicinamibacteria bacterium]|nr:DUF1761 domain-containing protein [Vicinamibacteria bacterium]